MKRFALLLIVLLAVSVFADYATNITVIEEVVTDSPAPEVDAVLDNLTEQLIQNETADNVLGDLAAQLAEKSAVVENVSEPVVEVPVVEEVPAAEPIAEAPVFDESVLADELAAKAAEPVVEAPVVEEVPEEPIVEEVPVEEVVEEVPFGPTGVVVEQSDNVTVIEEVTSPAVAPIVEDVLDNLLESLANETSVQAEQLVKPPSPELPAVSKVVDAEGKTVDSEILVSGSTVTIDFKEGPLKRMSLLNVENASELPRVDNVPTSVPAPDGGVWAQIYAIDPTSTNFTSGIVEVVAKGTALYKCKDWNFDARECDGEWQLVADDIVSGNTYLLELTPDDPGFGEMGVAASAFIAYRSNTGACGGSPLNCPKIRAWNASGNGTWGGEVELPTAGSNVRYANIKWSPTNQKLVLVTQSNDGFLDAYVCTANCTNAGQWTVTNDVGEVAGATVDQRRFDVAFETKTGDAMVVYAIVSTNTTCDYAYKVLPNSSVNFSGVSAVCIDDNSSVANLQYTWTSLGRNPRSDSEELVLVGHETTSDDSNAWVWNGTGWGSQIEITTSVPGTGGEDVAARYSAVSSQGMVLAADSSTAGNVYGRYWNGTGWVTANPGDIDPATAQNAKFLTLKMDPLTDYLQGVAVGGSGELCTIFWNGSNWSVISNIDDVDGDDRPADFEWESNNSVGRLVWETDLAGTTMSQRACTPQCNSSTTTFSSYALNGRWLALARNPTYSDEVKILGGRENSGAQIGSFMWNGTNYSNYGDTVISTDTTIVTIEAFSIAFPPFVKSVNPPTVTNASVVPTDPAVGNPVCLRVNVTDPNNVSSVIATVDRPVGADQTLQLFDTHTCNSVPNDGIFSNLYLVGQEGVHNWTVVNATDGLNNTGQTAIGLTFQGFIGPWFNDTGIFYPTSAAYNDSTSLNVSLINVSDNIYATQLVVSNNTFMFFNWTFNDSMYVRNVTVEHNYVGSPVAKLQIFNNSVWQDVCTLNASAADVNDTCDLNVFVNSTSIVLLRINVSNVTVQTTQNVDQVFIRAERVLRDNSLLANSSSVGEGRNISINGSYTIGNGGPVGNYTIGLNDTNHNITIGSACGAGKVFQATSINLSGCSGCANYGDGTVMLPDQQNVNYVIVWYLTACANSSSYSPINLLTYKVNGSGQAVFDNATGNIAIFETTPPQWFSPQKNETIVYWNSSVKFNTSWTNWALAGYIFSINQSGSWANSSFTPFSGTANVSENVSLISANAGSVVGWYFWANDTAGNSNQTDVQNFTVQSRPTSLAFSVNQSTYPQGRSPGMGYDIYIPFEARFVDSRAGLTISGADCYVTNNETSDNVTLTYNATTGNYTGQVSTYMMYDVVTFNATCSKANYNASSNSTSTNVWLFMYLWEWQNMSYGAYDNYTTHWLRKEPTNGSLYTLTETFNTSVGDNHFPTTFYFCGAGTNCSFLKDYNMVYNQTLRLNVSINDTSCQPYLCTHVVDWYLNELTEQCGSPVAIPANTPTLIEQNVTANYTMSQNYYLALHLHFNCSSAVSEQVNVYYNYTGEPASIEIPHARPTQMQSFIAGWTQIENNYTVGSNSTANVTRKWWITFNNTFSSPQYVRYWFQPQILVDYPNSNINGTIYIYNSTGQLWASDNASAGAPEVATPHSDNQVDWATEVVANNTAVNETLQRGVLNAIRDSEAFVYNATFEKRWNVSVWTVFTPQVTIYNITVWTNYSTYGVGDDWDFNVTKTVNGNTTDITSQVIVNTSAKTLAMPMTNLSGIVYAVAAKDKRPPAVFDLRPVANSTYNVSTVIEIAANVTDNVGVGTVLANVSYPNSSSSLLTLSLSVGAKYNSSFTIPSLTGQYNVTFIANDTAGNVNSTETTFFVGVDGTPPSVFDLRPVANTSYNVSTIINVSANVTDNIAVSVVRANVSYPNGSNSLLTLVKDGVTDKYNNTFTIPNLTGQYNITFIANDTAGNVNSTETTFFVGVDVIPPTITPSGCTPEQVNINGSTTCNATITDNVGISVVLANVTLPNSTVVSASVTNVSSNYSFTFNNTPLNGQYNVTWFANDTSGNSAAANDSFLAGAAPIVIINAPQGEAYDENNDVIISINASDPYGIDTAIAQVAFNGTSENITLGPGQQSDNFESDTINTSWFVENVSIGAGQTCIADINTTVPGKAFISISGNGTLPDTLCSVVSEKRVDGDFDISISFGVLNSFENDTALNFGLVEEQSSVNSARQLFIGLTNFVGYGRQYQIFADDGNFSGYVLLRDTNDTSGRMRVKRVGSNFTFYTWNGSWVEENVSSNTFNFSRALFAYFEAESVYADYGALNVSWDNFTVQSNNFTFGAFNDTAALGVYNVSIFVNNTLGLVNSTERTNFSIVPINDGPSVPWIFWPAPNEVLAREQYVTWAQVYDEENDSLQFNITLLNPDYSFNASVVSNYGNSTTTQYVWNTSNYPDGVYSLRVTVFENATVEKKSNSDYIVGNFTVDNTAPSVEFVPPTPANGSGVSGVQILNVSAVDPLLLQVIIYNSTSSVLVCNSSPCTYTWNTSLYPEGPAIFYATASDYDNTNRTDNLTLIVDRTPPSVFDLRPVANSSYAVSTVINISANVTDSVGVDVVLANVTYPNSTIVQLALTKDGATDKYNNTFTIPNLLGQYNVIFIANDTAGNINSTETTYFMAGGAPIITTSKSGSPNPVQPGDTLTYQILVNNTGDDIAFNVSVVELYPENVTFNGSSPVPSSGNDTWSLGNLSPGNAATINITVNVSLTAPTGSILNNTYNVTFANSSGQNTTITNSTLTVVGNDTIPPSVAIMSPLPNSTFLLNESVNITSNVTDNVGVDVVLVQIMYPDGNNETFPTSVSGSFYNLTFTNLTLRGNYTIRIIANDTLDNINNTETIVFARVGMHIIDLINSTGQFWNYSVNVTGNDTGLLNLTVYINDSRVHVINMTLHDEDSEYSVIRIDDDVPYNGSAYFTEYAIDTSGINYTNATVLVTATGDYVLYICKNYNFSSEDCIDGNWSEFMNLTPGQNYTVFLTPGDPGFLETSSAADIAVVPVNYTTFVIAYVNANLGRVQFKVMNTNGSIIVNTTDVDTVGIDNTSRVDVSMLNSTHFVISWAKGPSNNLSYELFQVNGSNASAPINLGSIGLNKDVGLGEIGGRYALCYANDTSNDAAFQMFFNNGTQAVGLSSVDANINPGATLQNLVDCAGINGTRWAYFYFDDQTNDAKFAILNETGGILAAATIDAAVGETAQVAVASMNNDRFGMVWYDSVDEDITIAIRTSNNVVVLAPTDVDTAAGAISRVAAGTVRRNVTSTEDLFVFAWYNNVSNTIRAAVYNSSGSQVTAPFTVDTQPGATFRLLDVASRDPITNNTLCPGRFVVAFSNSTSQGIFKGFLVNGSAWDGVCDLEAPSIVLNYPPAGFNTSNTSINFNWTASNGVDPVLECNLTIDGVVNASNIASPNGTAVNYTVSGFVDGVHLWNVSCVDDSGNVNTSETRNFTVDTQKPSVQLNYPPQGFNTSNTTINFNWTATNGIDTSLDCNLTIDGVVNASNITSPNGTAVNYTVSGFNDGTHYWNVTCVDDSGNTNTSETRNFTVDTVRPGITLNYPPAGFNTSNATINFNWTATDNVDAILSCNLTIDSVVNASNVASPNNTAVNYTVSGFVDGVHLWNVTCVDDSGNVNTSVTRNFTVDTVVPGVVLNYPPNEFNTSNTSINFNWTATNGVDTSLDCNLTVDGTVNASNIPSPNATPTNYTVSGFIDGVHLWNVTCRDDSGNVNTSETRNFTVDTVGPNITLNYPPPGFNTTNTTIDFNWTVTDNVDTNLTCNLTVDGVVNASNISSPNGTAVNYTVTGFTDGLHLWNVSCVDDSGNVNTSETRNFTVDTSGLNIALNFPPDGFSTTSNMIDFNWTATDNIDVNLTCNLTIDGVINASNVSSPNGTPTNYTVAGFSLGAHLWKVTCWDSGNNTNTSETRSFTITTVPPAPSGGGGSGGRGYVPSIPLLEKPGCIDGQSIIVGAAVYGPTCCSDAFCKSLGETWSCKTVDDFNICVLPEGAEMPKQVVAEERPVLPLEDRSGIIKEKIVATLQRNAINITGLLGVLAIIALVVIGILIGIRRK